MADVNVDKIVHNALLEKEWYERTKDFIRLRGYKKMLDSFIKASEEYNETYYKSNSFPKNWELGNLKITSIARKYGLKVKKGKAICPFHKDTDPSLSFNDDLGVFHCFGCGIKGNIITFLAEIKKVKKSGGD